MKKWLIGLAAVLLLLVGCVYVFIPGSLKISQATPIKCSFNGTYRNLSDKGNWARWWGSQANNEGAFSYNGNSFMLQQTLPHGADVAILQNDRITDSRIIIMPIQADSVAVLWHCTIPSGNNPFTRIGSYRQAVRLKNDFSGILANFKAFLEKTENVYGHPIVQTSTRDTLLVAARSAAATYPRMEEIYKLITMLQNYISANDALQTGYPMLNVTQTDKDQFQFQVAVPVNRALPEKGNIFTRRMVPGNFMMTEVKGGLHTIDHALTQLHQYAVDHQRPSMAIPFQLLITDRLKVQDTANWITRVYYPIM